MPLPLLRVLAEHVARQRLSPKCNKPSSPRRGVSKTPLAGRNIRCAELSVFHTIRIHDFRHSHVSLLANEGINIQEIARRLGHSRVEMTWNTYSHLYPREEEKAVEVLNRMA